MPPAEQTNQSMLKDDAEAIARDLLSIGAVTLSPDSPYTWASGRLAPIYCDNRMTMRYPRVRGRIAAAFEGAIRTLGWPCDAVVGTATAGIPHAAWLAARLEAPMAYVRSTAKDHGMQRLIEGNPPEGSHAVVIEDLVSTGGSSLAVVPPLNEAGVSVSGIMCIFTYGLPAATRRFEEADMRLHALCTFPQLVDVAEQDGLFSGDAIASLRDWYRDPEGWSEARK